MTENLRESYRIDADPDLVTELFHEGRVKPCTLHNLSAGGAKVTSALSMGEGAQCTLGVRLGPSIRTSSATPQYVSFLMEVMEATPRADHSFDFRLRSMTAPGSPEYEAAAKLVFTAQRARLAKRSGTGPSSPMVVDEQRRRRLRLPLVARFSKRSLRPDNRD